MIRRRKHKDLSDERLMTGICNGDTNSFNELYHRYNKRLLYYFYRMHRNDNELAQDLLQDIFMKVIEKPEMFDTRKRFSTWIFSVANNMCKNEYRKREIRSVVELHDNQSIPENSLTDNIAEMNLFRDELFHELNELDSSQRSAFLLKYREGFKIDEISKILNIPEGTVKSKLHYTVKKISEKLKDYNPAK